MKICLSLASTTMQEAVKALHTVGKRADIVELRVDTITDLNLENLLKKPRPIVIITNRRKSEGGCFAGSAAEQFDILSKAIKLGAEYIDVEYSWGESFIQELIRHRKQTKIIASRHNFEETPSNLQKLYQAMTRTGVDIVKIVATANDIADNKRMFDLLSLAKSEGKTAIMFCMGERGQISRILAGKYGGFLTYAALDTEQTTAPGQPTLSDLTKIFQVRILNQHTKVFGLVGNPVAYSIGIYYHNHWFKKHRSNAVYVNFLVDNLPTFVETFRGEFSGLSITMPFKQAIVPMLDSLDYEAASLGLVNTVIKKKDKLVGMNTDLPAVQSILQRKVNVRGKNVVVLGTGATAKTISYAALKLGGNVIIAGRSEEKSKLLAEELGCKWIHLSNLTYTNAEILVNATSVGMGKQKDVQIVPTNFLRQGMVVFDAVYAPPLTPLLNQARKKECIIISGTEFFKQQAQLQSKLFLQSIL